MKKQQQKTPMIPDSNPNLFLIGLLLRGSGGAALHEPASKWVGGVQKTDGQRLIENNKGLRCMITKLQLLQ